MILIKYLIFCSVLSTLVVCDLNFKYRDDKELRATLNQLSKWKESRGKIVVESIGKTATNADLLVASITTTNKTIGVPKIKFIANIHGNEPVGREILVHFFEHLRDNYGKNENITYLLDNSVIYILPCLNPDGFKEARKGICNSNVGRGNSRLLDLNRNYPDTFHVNNWPMASETKAVIKWMKDVPFILSASLHGGALVANYPYDSARTSKTNVKEASLTPDDDVFKRLATVYANSHKTMHTGKLHDYCNETFPNGITNGAYWYTFVGGMQDYNYMTGCMELTLEISCCKYPEENQLEKLWGENKMALINYSLEAHRGVTGIIRDRNTERPIAGANLQIIGKDMIFNSSKTGEFWRLLLPGQYRIKVLAKGYHPKTVPFHVVNYGNSLPKLTFLKIGMINISYVDETTTEMTTKSSTTQYYNSTNYLRNRFGWIDSLTTPIEILTPQKLTESIDRTANCGTINSQILFSIFTFCLNIILLINI